ncbi:MAG: tetratricopeptide repeat protein [Leptolyngbyaceae bacterium]|nr:tetratricopeptide repeat protein [Leptolyngbyaceae bacterium]
MKLLMNIQRLLISTTTTVAIALSASIALSHTPAKAELIISQATETPSQESFLEAFELVQQGLELIGRGESSEAVTALEESLDISRSIGDRELESIALIARGKAMVELGDTENARTSLQDGLAIAQDLGDAELVALAEGVLAELE